MIERLEPLPAPERTLRAAGLQPSPWSAGPGAVFGRHHHPRPKRLYVVEGAISFDGLGLTAGDGIRIPAGIEHSAIAGDSGVRCVEAFE
ncbi:MAG TPA: cupin domain-containing protein [Candidatus Dormibacteraeota bacterium]